MCDALVVILPVPHIVPDKIVNKAVIMSVICGCVTLYSESVSCLCCFTIVSLDALSELRISLPSWP